IAAIKRNVHRAELLLALHVIGKQGLGERLLARGQWHEGRPKRWLLTQLGDSLGNGCGKDDVGLIGLDGQRRCDDGGDQCGCRERCCLCCHTQDFLPPGCSQCPVLTPGPVQSYRQAFWWTPSGPSCWQAH